jgi:dipeptidyl aminopeptidase/acylaminoacyl peptidase
MKLLKLFFIPLLIVCCSTILVAQPKRSLEIEDLFRSKRVSDPQLSPDGKFLAFVVTEVDKAANKLGSDIWIIPSSGGEAKKNTDSPKNDRHPRWSPDGKQIVFESNRSGSYQIFVMSSNGENIKQLTTISTEASQPIWSPDGKYIAFVSSVFPEFSNMPFVESDKLNKQKDEEQNNSKVKARTITKLLYRHWDSWIDNKRQHIFIVPVNGSEPKDITPGDRDAVPTSQTFSAGDEFDFSPDGNEIAYTATPIPVQEEAWSTNHDIYTVNISTGERKQLTSNLAADGYPRYSPDGKFIAYRAQERAGFEADRWQLMLYDREKKSTKSLTSNFDASIESFIWSSNSKNIFLEAEDRATKPIWIVSIKGNDTKKIIHNAVNSGITVSSNDKLIAFAHQTISRPTEIYTANSDGKNFKQLTKVNDGLFSQISVTEPEYVWFTGADNAQVQMWIVKPPMFDAQKKYPLVYMIHGGPQGAWMNWSYRWNPQLWAAQGYVVALPNPRGSSGFGQKFLDEIRHDWGGKVFEDLMNGLAMLEKLPYIDTTRMAAAGASYGGYMMNWFQGHTDKFKTLVTHDGTFNFYNSFGATEEVWFDEWEHGIPWETPDFDKFSPHKYTQNFKTPNLVIHSELDYRVPVTEGLSLFTYLQRKGIPSKLLYFPDEGHWVLKPQNSELWHKTVFDWLADYLKK